MNIDNLLYIDEINIDKILSILEERYNKKKIYTYLGDVLISINPYKYYQGDENIYSFNKEYTEAHLWTKMNQIYKDLFNNNTNQVILVSGESGSGKTETVKQIIHYLNQYTIADNNLQLLEKIESAGLVLECFGNAKTERNNNSSRFGKYIQVYYDNNKTCLGMSTKVYLLERTRLFEKENNFHIFYIDEIDLKRKLIKAGFTDEQIVFIKNIIHAVKLLLKLEYNFNVDDINIIENLLGITDLYQILAKKKIKILDDIVEKTYDQTEFCEIRNKLIMKLYDSLFQWIVAHMNIIFNVDKFDKVLGILDIFGFEDLSKNSLEQLCINYTNEIIQGLLNQIIIENKIELYQSEGIPILNINHESNKKQIEIIENIFYAIDEECMIPKGTDLSFIQKLEKQYQKNSNCYVSPTNRDSIMIIKHYAGAIQYNVSGFLQKNMERINNEIVSIVDDIFTLGIKKKKNSVGKIKINSITNQFRQQLSDFIKDINNFKYHFIKCIKPNKNDNPSQFDFKIIKKQLEYNGVLEFINILKQGYSYHFTKDYFTREYSNVIDPYQSIHNIIFGNSRVFISEDYYITLTNKLNKLRLLSSEFIKNRCKSSLDYYKYLEKKNSINKLNFSIRNYRIRELYRDHLNRKIIFEYILAKKNRTKYLKIKKSAILLSNVLIKHKHKLEIANINRHASIIQRNWKKHIMNTKNKIITKIEEIPKTELTPINILENKIIELENKLSSNIIYYKYVIQEKNKQIESYRNEIYCYKSNADNRLKDKIRLTEENDRLISENKLLISNLATIGKLQTNKSWFYKLFN
jgi:myosin protein heavy chain